MAHDCEFGIIGMGRMGGGLAHQALGKGLRVVGASRRGAPKDLVDAGLVEIPDTSDFRAELRSPRDERKTAAQAIVMMRHGFGGHPFGPEQRIASERRESRVGDIFRPGEPSPGRPK
jgi:hypothetical protein